MGTYQEPHARLPTPFAGGAGPWYLLRGWVLRFRVRIYGLQFRVDGLGFRA